MKTFFTCDEITLGYICNHMEKLQSKIKYVVAFLTDDCLAILQQRNETNY